MSTTDTEAFEQARPRLVGIAYRMLGDVAAAEDTVQDAYLRWVADDRAAVIEPDAYLTTIVSRLAIDRLRSAAHRRETYVGPWLAEPVLFDPPDTDPGPDDTTLLAESVTIGFLALLDTLTPLERSVLLLHDAFGFSFSEIAAIVDATEAGCRKTASRARAKTAEHRNPTRARASTAREQELLLAFGTAVAARDIEAIKAVLTDDVVTIADGGGVKQAAVRPVVGPHRVSRFFAGVVKNYPTDLRVEMAAVNGEPAFIVFNEDGVELVLIVGATDAGIDYLYAVRNPDKLAAIASGYRLLF